MSFFKDKSSRGEIPYGDTIVRNVLVKAMPFISNHFNSHTEHTVTNDGEQQFFVAPISPTCFNVDTGKELETPRPYKETLTKKK